MAPYITTDRTRVQLTRAKTKNQIAVVLFLTSPTHLLLLLVVLLLAILLFQRRCQQDPRKKQPHAAHGLKVYPLVGTLPHLVKNRHRFLDWVTGELQRSPTHTMSYTAIGFGGGVITANPANIEHLVRTNFGNYPKGDATLAMVEDLLGAGIFNSDGDRWLRQRKDASHEFSTRSLRAFVADAVRSEVDDRLLPLLRRAAARDGGGRAIDVQDVLERFAFDNICRVVFGDDPACLAVADDEADGATRSSAAAAVEFMRAFDVAQNVLIVRLMTIPQWLWRVRRLIDAEPERRMRAALGTILGYTDRILRDRRARLEQEAAARGAGGDDLVSRLAARREHGDGDDDDESLRDVVTNFLLAGRDTTSSALTWFFWLVSGRPDVEDMIVREIRAVRASSSSSSATAAATSPFGLDELREMHYLHAAITESMRLYPPVAITTRRCERGEVLPDGTFVGAGWQVSYSSYAVARVADVWGDDCEEFRPERWLDVVVDGDGVSRFRFRPESPFKYPVFHGGPRTCLGKEMAYVQMKCIVAGVFERFTLRFAGDDEGRRCRPGFALAITLRMKDGLPMQVYEREK